MTAPALTPDAIGQSQLSNRWMLEVDIASDQENPVWVSVFGRKSFTFQIVPTTVDNSDSDTGSWSSQFTVGLAWNATAVVEHKLYNGDEDEGQAFIRTAAAPTGEAAQTQPVHVRFWDRFGREEVYEGWANPQWAGSGGERDSDKATITLTGQGALYGAGDTVRGETLVNPHGVAVAPTVASVNPATAAGGELVEVRGSNFNGATQVKFGASNATDFDAVSNGVIVAIVPAGADGAANVTVVNSAGTSNAVDFTRQA